MKRYFHNESGLTLVEILASIVILSIVLIAFMSFFTQSAKFTKFNKEKLTAVQVAEEIVAELRGVSDLTDGKHKIDTYDGYSVTIEVVNGPDPVKLPHFKRAIITVKANSVTGIKNHHFLRRCISR